MGINFLFAIRGLLSFVSFTEFTSAGRALLSPSGVEIGPFVKSGLFSGLSDLSHHAERTLAHLFGIYSALNGILILYVALYSHYRPIVNLGLFALIFKIIFLFLEAFIFESLGKDKNLIFPFISSGIALLAISVIPFFTGSDVYYSRDENEEILGRMTFPKSSSKKHR